VIQHTAPISPGSSGGPLLNRNGQVVGLNTFGLREGNSLFFAVPVNYVRAALDTSDGKWASLGQVTAAMAKLDKERADARNQEFLQKNFVAHKDSEGLFSVFVPRAWRAERTDFTNDENGGTRHVIAMFSDPDAEKAQITGWLSSGIRVHLRFPKSGGSWNLDGIEEWAARQFNMMAQGYRNAETSKLEQTKLGGMPALFQIITGDSQHITKKEIVLLTVAPGQRCLASIEVVSSTKDLDTLKLVNSVFSQTLKPSWN
jgi:hypothetical protein